jgi:hypothetical protein
MLVNFDDEDDNADLSGDDNGGGGGGGGGGVNDSSEGAEVEIMPMWVVLLRVMMLLIYIAIAMNKIKTISFLGRKDLSSRMKLKMTGLTVC